MHCGLVEAYLIVLDNDILFIRSIRLSSVGPLVEEVNSWARGGELMQNINRAYYYTRDGSKVIRDRRWGP